MPDDKKKFIRKPKADAWRFDTSPLVYNYDNYLNSLGYRAGISTGNFLHKPSPGGLYYPMSLDFTQSYADNSRAYNADPSKFENPQEVVSNIQFGQPTTYTDYTRGPREADMGLEFKAGATNMNPDPDWSGPYGRFDLGAGYSKLRQGYGNVEAGGGYKFETRNGLGGSSGAFLKAILQNKDLYGTLQDRVIPGQAGHIAGNVGQNKATWGYGLKGDINYTKPHSNLTLGARGSVMADMTQGKNNYRYADQSESGRVEMTPVINAEVYAKYPINYGINKIQQNLERVKKNDIAPKDNNFSDIDTDRLRKFSLPIKEDGRPNEFNIKPVSFGIGEEYPTIYKGDNGTHSLFGNIIMPDDSREFKNGGQFNRKFNLPEDSFKKGGNGLHDSIYSSSLEQYPAVYAKGGHMNFKSNAAYKAWLGYGHASGAFEKTPGNQAVSVQGHPHKVQHEMGGFLGNPYVNIFEGGGELDTPTLASMANMSVAEKTALIYQTVTQYVNQAKAEGRLGPNDNLSIDGVVAQILLETGNGTSSLVKRANNFGGIKADDNWTGPKTGQYRLYNTPEEGLKAQIDFYINNPRYRKNGVFDAKTPKEHFEAVQRAGYAEAKNYVSAGMGMVNSIPKRLAKVDMTKFAIPAATTTETPIIPQEEIQQGMQPINNLGIRPLRPIDIPMNMQTTPEIVPYTTTASPTNQMPDLSGKAPSIPKGWFGGGNTIFGGNKEKKFAQGGLMNQLTEFNEGGSHEENPLGGIPQGMNPNGGMNLVQEGETKNNAQEFIYSDDITISKGIAKQFNINSRFVGKTYADASKKANRTDSRRETDTIEQNAIARDLDKLAQAQETQKEEELQKDIAKMAEKHPEFMAQMMQAQEQQAQPPMEQPSPEEMAMMQQQGQMDPSMQGQQMDPAMMEQMQAQQGMMRYGGPMSYKCGGTMYEYGGGLMGDPEDEKKPKTIPPKAIPVKDNNIAMKHGMPLKYFDVFLLPDGTYQGMPKTFSTLPTLPVRAIDSLSNELVREPSNNSMTIGKQYNSKTGKWVEVLTPTNSNLDKFTQEREDYIQKNVNYQEKFKKGGNMYDFGGFMQENNDAFTQAGAGALKAAGKGASMGATIGSIVPGIGTAIGGAIGAGVGLFAGGIKGGIEGNRQDRAEQQAIMDAANQERLTGVQTQIPQEASNNTLGVLGQAAVQGGTDALGAFTKMQETNPISGMQDTSYQGFRAGGYMHNAGPMGQPLTNLYPKGGLLRPSNIDYGQFNPNLNNPYYSAQENTLPTSFNYSEDMDALPNDFGNYQAPEILGENNKGVVLNNDGTLLTGTGNAYDWNTGNMPVMPNYLTKKEEKEIEKEEEEKKKNQFSDYKTEQDAMKDKFSMNETLGQFVGSNLGAGYNLYQGIFGKKSKVPNAKNLFTPVDPYRMNINPQLRAAEEAYAGAARGMMNAAPGAGAYLTNRAMLAKNEADTKAGIRTQAENAYGTSKMQTDMFNSQNKSQANLKAFELKSAIDAAKQNYLQAGLEGIGQKTNADKANLAALAYANMHGGGEYGVEANPYLQQIAMEYQKRRAAKKA